MSPQACIQTIVSPEMTVLIGRGPALDAAVPDDAVVLTYGLGAIDAPASLWLGGSATAAPVLAEDPGVTRVVILIAPTAVARIEGRTLPAASERTGFHLPSELRAIALALRDCDLGGEAGEIWRAAKSIELVFETWRRLDAAALAPLAGDSAFSQADSLRLVQAHALIEERWREKLSLDGIARQCGLNREKLSRGFREMFHCTVAEALAERRLSQASHMLLTTDLPVASVGYQSGYMNNASFSRAFGRRFGVSPSDYRNQGLAA